MKKFVLCAAAALAALSLNAQTLYNKVTTTPIDWTGTYLIVCESENVVFNGGADTTGIDAKGGAAILTEGFTISEDVLTGSQTVDTATFTIAATEDIDWPWYIKSQSGLYLGHKDEDDNGLSAELELKNKCRQTLEIDGEGNLIAVARYEEFGPYNLQYNKADDQLRFRYYKSGKKEAIQIYRLTEVPSGLNTATHTIPACRKIFRNGQVLIIKNGATYNALGILEK